ncbi:hypothetical protein QJS10_CPB15g01194 [Acorus calamus]|uniref:Uncharacterized protein n=1 Tax=Acorus calamus TaxID=4465 RepID=A0AAV9DC72_ACOCL|nr:hypothetical protein QJS10_CPB15g01194 [Acorus calamus]
MMQARNTDNLAGRAEKTKSNTGNCGTSRQGVGVRKYVPINKGAPKLAGSGFTEAPHLSNSFVALETISESQNGNLITVPRVPTSEVVSAGVPELNENVIVQVESECQDETLEMNVSTEEAHGTPKGEIACTQDTNGPICLQEDSMEETLTEQVNTLDQNASLDHEDGTSIISPTPIVTNQEHLSTPAKKQSAEQRKLGKSAEEADLCGLASSQAVNVSLNEYKKFVSSEAELKRGADPSTLLAQAKRKSDEGRKNKAKNAGPLKLRFDHFLGYEGRIWILWRHDLLDLEILEESGQFVHGRVHEKHSQVEALITVIYASNLLEERILLWNNLKRLSRSIQSPWLVGGDFNEVRYSYEKIGGRPPNICRLQRFNDCIAHRKLLDIHSTGNTLS